MFLVFFGKQCPVFFGSGSRVIRYIPLCGDAAAARFSLVWAVVFWLGRLIWGNGNKTHWFI